MQKNTSHLTDTQKKILAADLQEYLADRDITSVGIAGFGVVNYTKDNCLNGHHEGFQEFDASRKDIESFISKYKK
jgi:hypothetical protein